MDTAFRPEAIRECMKITLPDRLHRHQHGPLNNTITQCGDTQWAQFAVAFRDVNPSGWQGLVVTREKFFAESL
ncbi:Uncharacterised protein [Klebsiella pneumoniae]|nr:Uncharacterised protein [Klebsiella pneumoniae]SLV68991.1 Uncharacterised protein [Klebsiella pneumoniae]SLV73833.1 Uncharacterised protein [Klebsiella pneumoniae]SLY22836.1 Uncharacterised protein [Klebsiella pneumoniae]SMA05647.1 Uncharacterised protein [Klebsiella pneumoniae]